MITGSDTEASDVVVNDTDSQLCFMLFLCVNYLQIKVFRLYGVVNIP